MSVSVIASSSFFDRTPFSIRAQATATDGKYAPCTIVYVSDSSASIPSTRASKFSSAIRLSFHVLAVEACQGVFAALAHPNMADSPRKGRDSAVTAHVRRFQSLRFAAEQATSSISELPPAEVDHLVGRAIREGWPASKLIEEIERRIERRKSGGDSRPLH